MLKPRLKFWGKPKEEGPRELPSEVEAHLIEKYGLAAEYVSKLQCLTKDGRHLNKQVTLMRVYDPAKIRPGGPSLRTYDSLVNYRYAIMFEGHTGDDEPHLVDRRIPTRAVGSAGSQSQSKNAPKKG